MIAIYRKTMVCYNSTQRGDLMKTRFALTAIFHSLIISFVTNSYLLIRQHPKSLFAIIPIFLLAIIFAGISLVKTKRNKVCLHGTILLYAFCASTVLSTVFQILLAIRTIPGEYMTFVWSLVQCVGVLFVVFWVGILCVYLTSAQLGFRLRLVGAICGLIPVVNLVVLFFIIKTTTAECLFEISKDQCNKQRESEKVCATKYPILMVHGVFFRDTKFFNYWGRIPGELITNGATIFYGNQPSAASIADSAAVLKARILQILSETGAEKVNIIAHSKGGLDCRYAIAKLGIGDCVASLTTVNTPHRGCLFADYLLTKIPIDTQNAIAQTYNSALSKFGEKEADFLAAVNDLTDAHCRALDLEMPAPDNIFCQSIGSVLTKASSGKFPMNFSYQLVKYFSGENDGLVSEDSFRWGQTYTLLKSPGKLGISHSDIIDLNRENIPGFDVREFYVNLVNDLKNRGL